MSYCKTCPHCFNYAPADAAQCPYCGQFFPPPPVPDVPPDATECGVSMAWTAVWGLVVATVVATFLGTFVQMSRQHPQNLEALGLALLFLLGSGSLLSFLMMRFRRLLLTLPGGTYPHEATQRRTAFAVVASLGVLLLLVVGIGAGLLPTELERRAAEAEERRIRWQNSPPWEPGSSLPPVVVQPRQFTPPPIMAPAAPPRRPNAGSSPEAAFPPAPMLVSPGSSGSPAPAAPAVIALPCGHRYVGETQPFGGGPSVSVCAQGHKFRKQGGSWVAVP